jgi:hypothetical protein
MKANTTTKGQGVSNLRRRKDKESESILNLHTHTKILKQQKQLNGRNQHIPININTECPWTQLPHQQIQLGKLD